MVSNQIFEDLAKLLFEHEDLLFRKPETAGTHSTAPSGPTLQSKRSHGPAVQSRVPSILKRIIRDIESDIPDNLKICAYKICPYIFGAHYKTACETRTRPWKEVSGHATEMNRRAPQTTKTARTRRQPLGLKGPDSNRPYWKKIVLLRTYACQIWENDNECAMCSCAESAAATC